MSVAETIGCEWATTPFDQEIVLNAIPRGAKTAEMDLSFSPTPSHGAVRIVGRLRNGAAGSVTLVGNTEATRLPFADRTIRIQYVGETNAVRVRLESYALA